MGQEVGVRDNRGLNLVGWVVVAGFVVGGIVVLGGPTNRPGQGESVPSSALTSALDKLAAVFQGSHSKEQIRFKLDQAFALHGVPTTEENYSRYGSVLIRLRKEIGGATEMEILEGAIMIRSQTTPSILLKLEDTMALAIVALQSDDR